MNIEQIVKAWKSEHETLDANIPANPVGQELTEAELQEVVGGMPCTISCDSNASLHCVPIVTYIA